MHSSVPHNGRLLSLAARTPEVNTPDSSVLNRSSRSKDLRVAGEGSSQIGQELEMLIKRVIRVEVRNIRQRGKGGREPHGGCGTIS